MIEEKFAIEKALDNWLQKNVIAENDKDTYRTVFAILMFGANKEKVKTIADHKGFEDEWQRLKESGYFSEKGKDVGKILIYGATEEDLALEILLMGLVAKGYIKRRVTE